MYRTLRYLITLLLAGLVFLMFYSLFGSCCESVRLNPERGAFFSIKSALQTYKIHCGRYPSTEQGLLSLVKKPVVEPVPENWIQLATGIPTDSWGNEYRYRLLDDGKGEPPFELLSSGPDGIHGNEDDLSSID